MNYQSNDVPKGALRIMITVQYITGEEKKFLSWHSPKFEGDKILIKTDYGVVEFERRDLMRLKTTTSFKNL